MKFWYVRTVPLPYHPGDPDDEAFRDRETVYYLCNWSRWVWAGRHLSHRFRTRQDAEAQAFEMVLKNPDLIGKVLVVEEPFHPALEISIPAPWNTGALGETA